MHSADGWREVLEPVGSRYRGKGTRLYCRGGAAFAYPEIYEFLEVEGMGYAIRLPANRVLQEAEVAVSRQMFKDILMLIARLRAPPAPA